MNAAHLLAEHSEKILNKHVQLVFKSHCRGRTRTTESGRVAREAQIRNIPGVARLSLLQVLLLGYMGFCLHHPFPSGGNALNVTSVLVE